MITLVESACLLSAISFAGYGLSCLFSKRMTSEFDRYGLAQLQTMIGCLQIAGSLGLLAGFYYPPLKLGASLGLAVMMLVAVLVRIKIRDSLWVSLPALTFFIINLYIFLDTVTNFKKN